MAKDAAQSVNAYMLTNAPTLAEASPMAWDLLKVLARNLMGITTSDHAAYVMGRKYAAIYAQSAIAMIIKEAQVDEITWRRQANATRREAKKTLLHQQPMLAV